MKENKLIAALIERRYDLAIAAVLMILAAIPRLIRLEQAVPGLHGDEAWTGIDARHILATGSIDPYVGSAMGQPTGPLYVTALVFALFGESITTIRLSMALFGIATIPLFYLLLRLYFARAVSVLITLSLAFSLMHLHYSRLGFMLISAPFFQTATLLALGLAARQRNLWWAAVGALFCGLGLYSYNTFLVFPPLILAYLLYRTIFTRAERTFWALQTLVVVGVFLLVTAPLTQIMITNPEFYFARHRTYSVFQTPELQQAETVRDQAVAIFNHVWENLRTFVAAGNIDGVDGFGTYYNFLPGQLALMAVGALVLLLRRNLNHLAIFGLGAMLLLSATFTFDAVYRRQILSLIPVFFLMGYGVHFVIERLKGLPGAGILAALALLVALESGYSLHTYWVRFTQEPGVRRIFAGDQVQTLHTFAEVAPPDSVMVFFTDGFYCNHENIRFLLTEQPCIGGRDADHAGFFNSPVEQPVTLVFMTPYHEYIDRATEWAPHGQRYDVIDNGRLVSILYTVNEP